MPSGVLTPQLEQVLTGSGLATRWKKSIRWSCWTSRVRSPRWGLAGSGPLKRSLMSPDRCNRPTWALLTRSVRQKVFAPVSISTSRAARKGSDGRLYTSLRDRTGQTVLKSPQDLLDANLATPDVLNWPSKRIPVMRGGKLSYVPKTDVDYVLPSFENAFSHVGNLVPFKSAMKGQRGTMASRMLTQALPLVHAEAPWVQSGMPGLNGTRSFEDEYGKHMGAVTAEQGGRVVDLKDGVMTLKHDDGSVKKVELFEHAPFNRKTFWHQTPLVQPGETFVPGRTLVKSNYTDKNGTMAIGLDARAQRTRPGTARITKTQS